MFRGKVVAVLAILVAACSAFGTEEGEVIEKKRRRDQNQNWLRRRWRGRASMAAEHCENLENGPSGTAMIETASCVTNVSEAGTNHLTPFVEHQIP